MPDITLRWVAASNADASTDYRIEADKTTPGLFETVVTRDATKSDEDAFTPTTTTLGNSITSTDTTIILSNEAGFGSGDFIQLGREVILLGNKNIDTYTECTRGVCGTLPVEHSNGATISKAHETYVDTNVNFGSRKVIRYRIKRVQGSDESIGAEVVIVNPPEPTYTNLCTVWGIMEDVSGTPQSGMTVKLTVDDEDNYGSDTGETVIKSMAEAVTDVDGFFAFQVRRDIAPLTLTLEGLVWTVQNLPEESAVNFLRT